MTTTRRTISLAALLIPLAALVASLAVLVAGIVMAMTQTDALVAALNSPDATAADVYGGQARLAIGSSLLGAGIVAVVLSLATVAIVAAIRAFGPRPAPHDEEWTDLDASDETPADAAVTEEDRRIDVAASGR